MHTNLLVLIGLLLLAAWIEFLLLVALVSALRFARSGYGAASGNSWWATYSDAGKHGEYEIFRLLQSLEGGVVLTNLYLPRPDGSTTEIDLLLLHPGGIYVVESKNYSGWIFGNEKDRHWTQTLRGRKNRFYNPVRQNQAHINALARLLPDIARDAIHSYIVFGKHTTLKNVTVSTPGIELMTLRELPRRLDAALAERGDVLSAAQREAALQVLQAFTHAPEETKAEHVRSVQQKAAAR